MSTFRVIAEWFGHAVGTHYLVTQGTTYKRFMKTEYVFDLDVTNTKVELAGPGTSQIDDTNDEIITQAPTFRIGNVGVYVVWFSLSEVADRFDGLAEGWRVKEVTCGTPDQTGEGPPPNEGAGDDEVGVGELPPVEYKGIEVRFKGHIDSGSISTESAAPTAKITVRSQEITVPIGPSTTKTSGGAAKDCTAKYQLCPDGAGDYTVAEIEEEPAEGTVVLVQDIKLKEWTHIK